MKTMNTPENEPQDNAEPSAWRSIFERVAVLLIVAGICRAFWIIFAIGLR